MDQQQRRRRSGGTEAELPQVPQQEMPAAGQPSQPDYSSYYQRGAASGSEETGSQFAPPSAIGTYTSFLQEEQQPAETSAYAGNHVYSHRRTAETAGEASSYEFTQ